MKRKSAELKRLARGSLTGRYGIPMAALVVSQVIAVVLNMPFSWSLTKNSSVQEWTIYYIAGLVISLLATVLSVGMIRISLRMVRQQEYQFKDLFYGFQHHPDRYILANLLLTLIYLIAAIPAIVLLVILNYVDDSWLVIGLLIGAFIVMMIVNTYLMLRYALVYYFLLDDSEIKITDALKKSASMMKGNKGRLFYIDLSFIGWGFLGVLSMGIGFLWIEPYIIQTQTMFYLDLCGDLDKQEGFYAEC